MEKGEVVQSFRLELLSRFQDESQNSSIRRYHDPELTLTDIPFSLPPIKLMQVFQLYLFILVTFLNFANQHKISWNENWRIILPPKWPFPPKHRSKTSLRSRIEERLENLWVCSGRKKMVRRMFIYNQVIWVSLWSKNDGLEFGWVTSGV